MVVELAVVVPLPEVVLVWKGYAVVLLVSKGHAVVLLVSKGCDGFIGM